MKKDIISTKNAPAALGPYSQAVKGGEFIFISGQIPIDPSTGKLVADDIKSQTRQSLENIKVILEAAGSSLAKVIKVSVFLSDMDDFQKMNEIYRQYFPDNFPARSSVKVSELPMNAKVEIEAIALT